MSTIHEKIANLIREGQELQDVYKRLINTKGLQFKIVFDVCQSDVNGEQAINTHSRNPIPEGMLLGIIDDLLAQKVDNGSRIKMLFKDKDIVTVLLIQKTMDELESLNNHLIDLGAPPFELPKTEKS